MKSIVHDISFAVSLDILKVFSGLLREEEYRDAFEEIFSRVKNGVEQFHARCERREQRLHPSKN